MSWDRTTFEAAAAIYDARGDELTWLGSVLDVLRPEFDAGLGLVAYRYGFANHGMTIEVASSVGLPRGLSARAVALSTIRQAPCVSVQQYQSSAGGFASGLGPMCLYNLRSVIGDFGGRDLYGVNIPAQRGGTVLSVILRAAGRISKCAQKEFELVRTHVSRSIERRRGAKNCGELFAGLSRREFDVLSCLARGFSQKETAYELGIAASTVAVLVHRASVKLDIRSRAELISRFSQTAFRHG